MYDRLTSVQRYAAYKPLIDAARKEGFAAGVEAAAKHMDKRADLARQTLKGREAKSAVFSYEEYAGEIRALCREGK